MPNVLKTTPKIYILHENEEWIIPLRESLDSLNVPYEEWFLDNGVIDLTQAPPEGIFYNRMSASSHTRGHRWGPEYAVSILAWLKSYDRRIINGPKAINLEISKIIQYAELRSQGVHVPKTYAAIGKNQIIKAAEYLKEGAFITKHNRAGKGLGVRLFKSIDALQEYVENDDFEIPIDGITLIQEYIRSPKSQITRVEFVGGELIYALNVDTSEGFELCPADSCNVGDNFCPTTQTNKNKFTIDKDFYHPVVEKYKKLLRRNDIEIAGIEFISNKNGDIFTYDINTNTNYNQGAEIRASIKDGGMMKIAQFLYKEYFKNIK